MRYAKSNVSIGPPGAFFRVVHIWPKKEFISFRVGVANANDWIGRLEEVGVEASAKRAGRLIVRVKEAELKQHENLIRELLQQCVSEYEA